MLYLGGIMLTLRLDSELEKEIEEAAEAEGVSKSALVREVLLAYVAKRKTRTPWELGSDLFGKHDLGNPKLSTDRKAILTQRIQAKAKRIPAR
jgi:RHH-type transcriptional regulator, rel operon repressor / antitoxin RelB